MLHLLNLCALFSVRIKSKPLVVKDIIRTLLENLFDFYAINWIMTIMTIVFKHTILEMYTRKHFLFRIEFRARLVREKKQPYKSLGFQNWLNIGKNWGDIGCIKKQNEANWSEKNRGQNRACLPCLSCLTWPKLKFLAISNLKFQ